MCTHVCVHMCIFMKRHTHTFKITGSPVSPKPIRLQRALSHPPLFCNLDVASFIVRSTPPSNEDTCSPSAVVYPRWFQNDCTHTKTMANVQKNSSGFVCSFPHSTILYKTQVLYVYIWSQILCSNDSQISFLLFLSLVTMNTVFTWNYIIGFITVFCFQL